MNRWISLQRKRESYMPSPITLQYPGHDIYKRHMTSPTLFIYVWKELIFELLVNKLSYFCCKNISADAENPWDLCIYFGCHIEANLALPYGLAYTRFYGFQKKIYKF